MIARPHVILQPLHDLLIGLHVSAREDFRAHDGREGFCGCERSYAFEQRHYYCLVGGGAEGIGVDD